MDKINIEKIINQTTEILKKGGLVIFPSDTVYGALVDSTNEKAVKKLIAFKNRPPGKAISIFMNNFKMVEDYVVLEKEQKEILAQILPGCYTVILNSKHKTSKFLESESGSLGIRIPKYEPVLDLVRLYGKPITATSANLAGKSPCYSIKSLLNQLPKSKQEMIDFIADFGTLPRNKPSTVIDLTKEEVKILRQGDMSFKKSLRYFSNSPEETREIAKIIFNKIKINLEKPLVVIIEGELGVGKTVFVKGLGNLFGLEKIISPSYVIFYEYKLKGKVFNYFFHFDLYNINSEGEFDYLNIRKYFIKKNLLIFEWGEKTGKINNLITEKADVIYVKMKYINEKEREILVSF
jgi:L-threonylcarbamoyladenylate synthase